LTITACTHQTPAGPLSVLVTDEETVIAAGFTDAETLIERLRPNVAAGHTVTTSAEVGSVSRCIDDYLRGALDAFNAIRVDQPGTDLQHEVWTGLRAIPPGETRTYTELAAMTSRPRAVRAAGTACGRNLIAPMVPCHRALRTDGSLGGYYYGLDVKRWLLAHEGAAA
jgi:methylated-DNA-[protein]-cysteine S-methyltransferase